MSTVNKRWELQDKLEELLGNSNVYFQPDDNIKLEYPCIVYNRATPFTRRADGILYMKTDCYELTLINEDPDTELCDTMLNYFTYISQNKPYLADGMYHYPFVLHY